MEKILIDYALYVDSCVADNVLPASPLNWLADLIEDSFYEETTVTQVDIETFQKTFTF